MKTLLAALYLLLAGFTTHTNASFLFISSEESWIGMGLEFFSEDVTYSTRKHFNIQYLDIGDNGPEGHGWHFSFNTRDGSPLTPGVYETTRSFNIGQPEIFIAVDFDSNGHGASQLPGILEIHEAVYLGDSLYKLAADFFVLEDGDEKKWNYGEIRLNSNVPHLVPEPSSLLLLAAGSLILLRKRR